MSLGPISATPSSPVAATAAAGGGVAAPAAQSAQPAALGAATAQTPLSAMLAEAAMSQDSLAPLLSDLAVAVQSPALPDDVRATATQLLAAQTPLGADATAQGVQSALRGSGVFLEAALAAALQSGEAPATLQGDLKALLLRLVAASAQQTPESAPDPRSAATTASAERPPPPLAGAALAGQAAARPSLDPGSSAATLVHALRVEAQASLARVQLSQAASLPRPGEPPRWSFEAPVATPAGTAMAQFEISRDGRAPSSEASGEPTWRARFSLDAAPGGPVHVELSLGSGRTHVRLMAPDDDARQALAAGQDSLAQALASDETPDVTVRVTAGAPAVPPPAPGQLLDRRT